MARNELERIADEIEYYDRAFFTVRLPKIYIRDIQNPFDLPVPKFKKRYRFSQESVLHIVELIKPGLKVHNDNRGLPVSPELSVLLCLRFYATASFQIVCGDLLGLSQSTACLIITRISKLLANLLPRYIKFPRGAEAGRNRELFQAMGSHGRWPGLPGLDGAVDCTHVKIVNTPGCQHHEAYRNRKGHFSLNVQVVAGPRTEILDIVARWAGSTHDSRIFQMSSTYVKYTTGVLNGRLLGDSGYPTLPFLLTPIRPSPEDPPSIRYNRAQIKTRNVVERTFGLLKRRFPCLSRGLGNKLETVANIIVACAVLHNLALTLNDVIDVDDVFENEPEPEEQNVESVVSSTSSGFILRNSLIADLYT